MSPSRVNERRLLLSFLLTGQLTLNMQSNSKQQGCYSLQRIVSIIIYYNLLLLLLLLELKAYPNYL